METANSKDAEASGSGKGKEAMIAAAEADPRGTEATAPEEEPPEYDEAMFNHY